MTSYFSLHRQLLEPVKLVPYLVQPEISNLHPDILAAYIQAATKVFGYWTSELAQNWDNDALPEIRQVVESMSTRMKDLASSVHVEVQERVWIVFLA